MLADSDRLMGTIEQVLRAARTSQTKHAEPLACRSAGAGAGMRAARAPRHHLPPEALDYQRIGPRSPPFSAIWTS